MTVTPAATILLVGADDLTARQVARVGDDVGLSVIRVMPPGGPPAGMAPSVVVVDLAGLDAVGEVRSWRKDHPDLLIAGYIAVPDRERWEAAERAGADLVVNRGALARGLRRMLADSGPFSTRRRRAPLFDAGEVAGRLGLVKAVEDTPVGPVAVYRAGERLVGIEDVCPHAGACLSDGAVEDGAVTCPAHGSRFDLGTGERVRGPADRGVKSYTVVEQEGRVWLVWL
ncbi:MAG: Rieske (2Fe-2S) protein [Acidimicrobiales bacterium]